MGIRKKRAFRTKGFTRRRGAAGERRKTAKATAGKGKFARVRAVSEMRVLLTRPYEDSQRTAQVLAECGHDAVIAPLFEVEYFDGPVPLLDGVQAVLATSAHGVRGLARRTTRRDIPLFAVGAHTATAAEREGFRCIGNAHGDATALATLVSAQLRPKAGALLHAAGTNASPALANELTLAGFELRTTVFYGIAEAPELPAAASDALRADLLDAVLLYSPRSARLFADRVTRAGLASFCARLIALCISSEAAAPIESMFFAEIRTAAHPNQESLLSQLTVCCQERSLPARSR